MKILFLLAMCHFIGDYLFQSNFLATTKGENWYHLLVHCILYVIPFWFVFGYDWRLAVLLAAHFVIDALKARYRKISYLSDQCWHWALITLLYGLGVCRCFA